MRQTATIKKTLCSAVLLVLGSGSLVPPDIEQFISRLHVLQWYDVTTDDAQQMVSRRFKRVDADIPTDSQYWLGPCSGTAQLKAKGAAWELAMTFDKRPHDQGTCTTTLHAVTLEVRGRDNTLTALKSRLLFDIGAAGEVAEGEYQWRDHSSSTRYVLYASIISEDDGSPNSLLTLRLLHSREIPEKLRDLPPPLARGRAAKD